MKRVLATGVMAVLIAAGSVAAGGMAAAQQSDEATCSTLDVGGTRSGIFRTDDEFRVQGTGFVPRSTVIIHFRQDTRTHVLARPVADAEGEILAGRLRFPEGSDPGRAELRLLGGPATARCDLTLQRPAIDPRLFWAAGGGAGLLVAVVVLFLILRGTRSSRRRREDDLEFLDEVDEAGFTEDKGKAVGSEAPVGVWGSQAPGSTARPHAAGDAMFELDDPPSGEGKADQAPEPSEVSYDRDTSEPPILPEGWDEGKLRSGKMRDEESLSAIERLRREVQAWKKDDRSEDRA